MACGGRVEERRVCENGRKEKMPSVRRDDIKGKESGQERGRRGAEAAK